MSLDFLDWPVVWVSVYSAQSIAFAGTVVWAQRRCPPELVDSRGHVRFRIVQVFAVGFWLCMTMQWGPGNLLPDFWADLAGTVFGTIATILLMCLYRTMRRLNALDRQDAAVRARWNIEE